MISVALTIMFWWHLKYSFYGICSMQDVQSFNSVVEMEKFLLEHGEQVIDVLGAEVDRIELEIKVRLT